MKDGATHTGFVEANGKIVQLRIVTGQILKLDATAIKNRKTSHQSLMPIGLVQTREELRNLIIFMMGKSK